MTEPEQKPPTDPLPPKEPLPKVEPPSAGFLLQLFVIPMVIVGIIVTVWMMFSWLAHLGSNPQQLVTDLKRINEASWQKALTLADLLRNPDYDELRDSEEMAQDLAQVLQAQVQEGQLTDRALKLRMFLCRALGEFRDPCVIPVLLEAAETERDEAEIDIRRTALEALAVHATETTSERLAADKEVMRVLLEASRERDQNGSARQWAEQQNRTDSPRDELRATAAYVLGVMGSDESLERLEFLAGDGHPNVRYNAGLGLARKGDTRAVEVLLEMLDPANQDAAPDEQHQTAIAAKRLIVLKNGIAGAGLLADRNEEDDLAQLQAAVQAVVDSELESFPARLRRGIRISAEDALISIDRHQQKLAGL